MIDIALDVDNLLDDGRAWPCHTNRASSMGHPCTRHLTYLRTSWDKAASLDPYLRGVFATGNLLEGPIGRILSEAGEKAVTPWRIVGGQQALADTLLKDHQITGHIDGVLEVCADDKWETEAVADVKTCSDYTFDAINSVEDLLKDKDTFFYKWYVQLQLYALGMGIEQCCVIMVRKSNLYEHKAIWFDIDFELGEAMLNRAREINAAVELDKRNDLAILPPKINRPKVCNKCPFVQLCNPTLELDAGETFDDAEAIELLDRRAELAEAKSEFTKIDKALKLALPKGELVRCGNWLVYGKLIEPADKASYWKRTYENVPVLP